MTIRDWLVVAPLILLFVMPVVLIALLAHGGRRRAVCLYCLCPPHLCGCPERTGGLEGLDP